MGGAAELPMTRLGTDCVLSKLRWPFATPSETRQSLSFFFYLLFLGTRRGYGTHSHGHDVLRSARPSARREECHAWLRRCLRWWEVSLLGGAVCVLRGELA